MAEEADATARILAETLAARFPGRLGPDEVEGIRKQIEQARQQAEKLRSFPLTNADEPEPIFQARARED